MIVRTDPDAIALYLSDASNMPGGNATAVYVPESDRDVVELLARASVERMRLTVSGTGTGLVGGRVPFGGAVLSTERMRSILAIDVDRRRVLVEPGVVLAELQDTLEARSLLYPPDPTERSASIGGTIATNASGARTFHYGPTRSHVTWLRVVLADGHHLELRRGEQRADGRRLELRTVEGRRIVAEIPSITMPSCSKHAAGYFVREDMDPIDLFIGSEGTLGVVTGIELAVIDLPEHLFSGVVFFRDESSMLAFVAEAREASMRHRADGTGVIDARALEFIDADALELIRPTVANIPAQAGGGAIWFEQETTPEDEEAVLAGWSDLIDRNSSLLEQSWFAIGAEDQRRMREFRHAVPEAVYAYLTEHGQTKIGTDMAVPHERFEELFRYYRKSFGDHGLRTVVYGHIGNAHLHANILVGSEAERRTALEVYARLVDEALAMGGTLSAEHGVGKLKRAYLLKMYGRDGVEQMRRLRRAFDPEGILGAGTMFDS